MLSTKHSVYDHHHDTTQLTHTVAMLFGGTIFYTAFLLLVVLVVNAAMHNVTVDDNDPSITYQPHNSWILSVVDVLDAGGRHHITSDTDATASFTFTGEY